MSDPSAPPDPPSDEVPRLPRGRGLRLSGPDIVKIAILGAMLVAIIVMQRPCSDSVAKFVTSFDGSGSAEMPKPGNVDRPPAEGSAGSAAAVTSGGSDDKGSGYVHLTPDMTEEQVREAIEKARTSPGSN